MRIRRITPRKVLNLEAFLRHDKMLPIFSLKISDIQEVTRRKEIQYELKNYNLVLH